MNRFSHFISCDWGTSNFRIRLVATEDLHVLSEHKTAVGIKNHFQEFKAQRQVDQDVFFAQYLTAQMEKLDCSGTTNVPIVASGMLSSSIGMRELPYAKMPIAFSGENLISEPVQLDGMPKMQLISGVRTNIDVMRGEEVQAIGLAARLPKAEKGILMLPGTHSKHISFNKGRFEHFVTYMTGELFEIIGQHSILATSLDAAEWNPSFQEIFLEGVKKGLANQQMAALFSIRANSLLNNTRNDMNSYYLSGLLIGGELSHLKNKNETVYLAATAPHLKLYTLALQFFLPSEQIVYFEPETLENALLAGQQKILENHA